jgi:hypothetical protein
MHWCEGEKTALLQTWVLARLSSLQMCCFVRGGVVFQSAHQAQSAWEKKLKPFALLLALVVFILSF